MSGRSKEVQSRPEVKKAASERWSGEKNPNYGGCIKYTEARRKKTSDTMKEVRRVKKWSSRKKSKKSK